MLPELYKVLEHQGGFLAVMPRPRAGDWLADEIAGLRFLGVGAVASLLEAGEVRDLELELEAELVQQRGMAFLSYPIVDRGVPAYPAEFAGFVHDLVDQVTSGVGVAIHCRAGIGRSGLTAAAVLVGLGYPWRAAFGLVSAARGLQVPDTQAQMRWLGEHWPRFASRL